MTDSEYNNKKSRSTNFYINLKNSTIKKNNLESGDKVYLNKYKVLGNIIIEKAKGKDNLVLI